MNNLLPQAFFANSDTAAPQDFVTMAGSVMQPFSGYSAVVGNTPSATLSETGVAILAGPASANALKLSNSAIDLAGNTMTIGSATQTGLLLSTGVDVISTSSVTVPDLAFGIQAARIAVNNTLVIGTALNPVRVTTSGGLNKFGPGTLSLSSANVAAGDYQVSQGTLKFLANAAFTNGSTVTILPGATLDTNGLGTVAAPLGIMGLAGFGTVNIGAGCIATGASASSFGGSLVGTGTLVHRGANGQTLNGNSPGFSGGVVITSGSATDPTYGLMIDANVVPSNLLNPGPLGIGITPIQLGATSGLGDTSLSIGLNVNRFERDINVRAGSAGLVAITGVNDTIATITSNITLNRTLRLALGSFALDRGSFTFTGTISDGASPGSLQIYGGQVALWGNNTYSGGTLIEVDASGNAPLGIGSDTALGTGPARLAANFNNTIALRADNGNRALANNFTMESSGANIVFGFVGINSLSLNGTVDLNTTSTNNLVRIFKVSTTGSAVVTLNNTIFTSNGTASVNKVGGGTLVFAGANTYTLGTTLTEGVLGLGSSSGVNAGPVGTGPLTFNGGTLRAVNGARSINNVTTVGNDFAIDGSNSLTLAGTMDLGAAPRSVVVTNSAPTIFGGIITSSAGSGLVKQGSGYLTFGADNTYTGNTVVAGGRLYINNPGPGSGTSAGTVTVNSLAGLGGTGRIAGAITVNSGGTLAPGASIGTLTSTNNTNLAAGFLSGANWEVELNHPNTGLAPVNGVTHDYFFNGGANSVLTLGSSLNLILIGSGGTTVPYTKNVPVSYTIATFNNSTVGAGVVANGTTYTVNTTNFFPQGSINVTGYLYSAAVVGNNLVLTVTPVPEPATVLGICALAAGAATVVRRRTKPNRNVVA